MARSISTIYKFLEDSLVAGAASVGLVIVPSNWKITDYKKLILNNFAQSQGIQEQLYDSHRAEVESSASVLPPNTAYWLRDRLLNFFQYDAVDVQIFQFDASSVVPYYTLVNPAYRVVKYCSVVPGTFGKTTVKIAGISAGSPSQLGSSEIAAAQFLVTTLGVPGIEYEVVSRISDKAYIQADVYYDGIYSAVIRNNVKNAISNYYKSIPFDGKIVITDLIIAVKSVAGVKDLVIKNLWARENSVTVANAQKLITEFAESQREYQTYAGYIVPETTVGSRFDDFRTGASGPLNLEMIPQ